MTLEERKECYDRIYLNTPKQRVSGYDLMDVLSWPLESTKGDEKYKSKPIVSSMNKGPRNCDVDLELWENSFTGLIHSEQEALIDDIKQYVLENGRQILINALNSAENAVYNPYAYTSNAREIWSLNKTMEHNEMIRRCHYGKTFFDKLRECYPEEENYQVSDIIPMDEIIKVIVTGKGTIHLFDSDSEYENSMLCKLIMVSSMRQILSQFGFIIRQHGDIIYIDFNPNGLKRDKRRVRTN